ncbi:50S ribosomal protein L31 [Candidatus Providencia siddallii]|uniref:Large ribosomal subunit protein bL31 n=1 Tax=Candidatus Providencia siddallii TaxID=1715285 RepID=A0ABP1CE94_9GAMM
MKKNIHPKYNKIDVFCSCGNNMSINSTANHTLNLDVCSNCHPFYIGKQRDVVSGDRVDKFNKRFKISFFKKNN